MQTIKRYVVLLTLLLVAACDSTKTVSTPTQVLLHVTCDDAELLARTTTVKVLVSAHDDGDWRDVTPASFDVDKFEWPLELPIFPRKGSDESRQFQVIVQAFENDLLLAETRAVTRFVPGKHKRLDRELYFCPADPGRICATSSCRGEACEVCNKRGMCEKVEVFQELPDGPSETDTDGGPDAPDEDGSVSQTDAAMSNTDAGGDMDAGATDAGAGLDASATDAGSMDAGAIEAGSSTDAEAGAPVDAGTDSGVDAALPACTTGMTRCGTGCVNLTTSAMNCGRCGRTCRSNSCNASACAATSVLTHSPNPDAGTYLYATAIDPPLIYYKEPSFAGVQRISTNNSTPSLVTSFARADIIGLSYDQGYLYALRSAGSNEPKIERLALSQVNFEQVAGTEFLYPSQLRTNRDRVYVSSFLSIVRIVAFPKTGGTDTTIANGPSLSLEFEVDEANAFIRDSVGISRVSASTENSPPTLVAAFENGETCRDMILQGDRLLFATSQRVAIVSKMGGAITNLAAISGVLVAADADSAYFVHGLGDGSCTAGIELYRVPLAGGGPVLLGAELADCRAGYCCPTSFMQDTSALYWIRGDGLAIRRLEK